jgi:HPt (histidine-containing phosphotransfer) domain-containing protein
MTPPPLIDRAVIDGLFDYIGADGARSVVELFVDEGCTYRAAIAEAAGEACDTACRDRARRAAHSLKSGAGQIGAAALAAAAAAVERAAADGAPDLAQAAAALETCAAETMKALLPFLGKIDDECLSRAGPAEPRG